MWFSTDRARTERRLAALDDTWRHQLERIEAIERRLAALEGLEFALEELRRQARNAVRSLERAAANAQDAPGPTNGKGARVQAQLPPPDPPGPRRNY